MLCLAVVTIIRPNQHMKRFTTTYMKYFKMVHVLPCGDWDFLFRFGIQIVDDEDVTSDKFSLSVIGKPLNTLVPIVSRSQLFQGQSRTLLSSHILQVSDEKQIECMAISVIAGRRQGPLTIYDVSQRNYFTPTEHHIVSEVYTRDYRNNCAPSIVP